MNEILEQAIAAYIFGIISCFPLLWIIFVLGYFILFVVAVYISPVEVIGTSLKEGFAIWRFLVTIPCLIAGMFTVSFIKKWKFKLNYRRLKNGKQEKEATDY